LDGQQNKRQGNEDQKPEQIFFVTFSVPLTTHAVI
jgi:hypothetical protein